MHWLGENVNDTVTDSLYNIYYVENFAERVDTVGTITFKHMRFMRNSGKFGGAAVCSERASMTFIRLCC